MDEYELCLWEEFQKLLNPTGIVWIFQQQLTLFTVVSNVLQKVEIVLFPCIFLLLSNVLKEVIPGKVGVILREEERVNATSGGGRT